MMLGKLVNSLYRPKMYLTLSVRVYLYKIHIRPKWIIATASGMELHIFCVVRAQNPLSRLGREIIILHFAARCNVALLSLLYVCFHDKCSNELHLVQTLAAMSLLQNRIIVFPQYSKSKVKRSNHFFLIDLGRPFFVIIIFISGVIKHAYTISYNISLGKNPYYLACLTFPRIFRIQFI